MACGQLSAVLATYTVAAVTHFVGFQNEEKIKIIKISGFATQVADHLQPRRRNSAIFRHSFHHFRFGWALFTVNFTIFFWYAGEPASWTKTDVVEKVEPVS